MSFAVALGAIFPSEASVRPDVDNPSVDIPSFASFFGALYPTENDTRTDGQQQQTITINSLPEIRAAVTGDGFPGFLGAVYPEEREVRTDVVRYDTTPSLAYWAGAMFPAESAVRIEVGVQVSVTEQLANDVDAITVTATGHVITVNELLADDIDSISVTLATGQVDAEINEQLADDRDLIIIGAGAVVTVAETLEPDTDSISAKAIVTISLNEQLADDVDVITVDLTVLATLDETLEDDTDSINVFTPVEITVGESLANDSDMIIIGAAAAIQIAETLANDTDAITVDSVVGVTVNELLADDTDAITVSLAGTAQIVESLADDVDAIIVGAPALAQIAESLADDVDAITVSLLGNVNIAELLADDADSIIVALTVMAAVAESLADDADSIAVTLRGNIFLAEQLDNDADSIAVSLLGKVELTEVLADDADSLTVTAIDPSNTVEINEQLADDIDSITVTATSVPFEPSPPLQANDSYNKLLNITTTNRPQDAGLVGYWPMDETSGTTIFDKSTNSYHLQRVAGTVTGGASAGNWSGDPNWISTCYSFDGSSYFDGNIEDLSSQDSITIGAWVVWLDTYSYSASAGDPTISNSWIGLYEYWESGFAGIGGGMRTPSSSENGIQVEQADSGYRWGLVTYNEGPTGRTAYWRGTTNTAGGSRAKCNTPKMRIGGRASTSELPGQTPVANAFLFKRTLSAAEMTQLEGGPEPIAASGGNRPTLSFGATDWTGTTGDWDSQSNGTVTHDWELREHPSNLLIDSGAGTPGGSNPAPGQYYIAIRAYNNGGYDGEEQQYSLVQTLS